ncbi:MAG: adenylyl-sulfate kinase [Proteobacteria bacterium]|nr:adenylyl-sulfate kinase [Pseudomonadota bacterium]
MSRVPLVEADAGSPAAGLRPRGGRVVWITGLSAAGKSTISAVLTDRLRARGEWCVALDGDALRDVFGRVDLKPEDYERSARLALGFQYARLARLLAGQGSTVIVTTISLFHELHAWNRQNLPGYFEVYIRVPLEELRRRDPKGLYRRYEAGEVRNIAGLDQPFDEPAAPDLLVDFVAGRSADAIATEIVGKLPSDAARLPSAPKG